jgi:hypothetical protein
MAANRYLQMRAMILAAVRTAQEQTEAQDGATPTKVAPSAVLEGIVMGKFETELQEGKTLISTNEAGGTASFCIVGGLNPSDIVEIAMEALTWLQDQPDPNNPPVYPAKRIKRLRASFAKATI